MNTTQCVSKEDNGMAYESNLDKLKKAGCDLFVVMSGNAMMGISEDRKSVV